MRDLAKRVNLKRLFRGTLHQLESRCGFFTLPIHASVCTVLEQRTMFFVRRDGSQAVEDLRGAYHYVVYMVVAPYVYKCDRLCAFRSSSQLSYVMT